jgi:hypothetical protein
MERPAVLEQAVTAAISEATSGTEGISADLVGGREVAEAGVTIAAIGVENPNATIGVLGMKELLHFVTSVAAIVIDGNETTTSEGGGRHPRLLEVVHQVIAVVNPPEMSQQARM